MLIFTQTEALHFNPVVFRRSCRRTISSALFVSWHIFTSLFEWSQNFLLFFSPLVGCSHVRAWQYFVESIRRPMAFLCDRCDQTNNESKECMQSVPAYMGFKADRRLRGKYYLTTNSVSPYGRNFPIWMIPLNLTFSIYWLHPTLKSFFYFSPNKAVNGILKFSFQYIFGWKPAWNFGHNESYATRLAIIDIENCLSFR